MYTLYYISADKAGQDSTWSVYSEQYTSIAAAEPIDGSQRWVMTCPTEIEADRQSRRLQKESYRLARLAHQP